MSYCKELPLGMSTEVFSFEALKRAYEEANDSECEEHVTPYLYKNGKKFRWEKFSDKTLADNSSLRLTVDTVEDWDLIEYIYSYFGRFDFRYEDVLNLFSKYPNLPLINKGIIQKKIKYNGEE